MAQATGPGSEPPASPSSARKSIFATKARDDLVACNNCGRNFAEDRIEKHTQICLKTSQKKRKTFNMTKVRTEGTEAAQFIKKGKKASAAAAKVSVWKGKAAARLTSLPCSRLKSTRIDSPCHIALRGA